LAAWLRRIPAVVYLPDLEPGAAIKFISRFVQSIAATFQESGQYFPAGKQVVETGYPVRAELRQAAAMDKVEAFRVFDLTPERKTLFVFGGSRGARSINEALIQHLPDYLETMQVIHISGTLTWAEVETNAQQLPEHLKQYYRPYPYLHEEMGAAFRAADLIVARAGASMLGEGPMFGTPAVLVPYPHAWRYQKVNADYLADRGAAVRLNDEQLQATLWSTVSELMQNDTKRNQMAQAARALCSPNAAQQLAKHIMNMGRGIAHA
jgi:UDP-N-acetylglucosamine--N-acetylmuramyl-(pentapeptide) pyrophosphoryl-undecaprenol N-acetylglucosamine transferase